MSLAFKRFKTYLRISLVLIVVVGGAIVLWKNRTYSVPIWFFGLTDVSREINVLWLIMWTVFATQTIEWVFRFSRGLWKDWGELKRDRQEKTAREQQAQREAQLAERERRIEQMLKKSERGADSPAASEAPKQEKGTGGES